MRQNLPEEKAPSFTTTTTTATQHRKGSRTKGLDAASFFYLITWIFLREISMCDVTWSGTDSSGSCNKVGKRENENENEKALI